MKRVPLVAALGAALGVSTACAAPPAALPPPVTGGVRAPGRFSYPYTRAPGLTLMHSNATTYPSGATSAGYGYRDDRYPLGGGAAEPRTLWYW